MIDITNIHSLTDFQRNTKKYLQRLRKTGEPEVLTINGEAEVVVQSAEAYQKLVEQADLADSVRILRQRLDRADRGDKGIPADQVMKKIRSVLGLGARR